MSPELKQIVQGTHRVNAPRMDALRNDIAGMAASIKPLRQGMDNEEEVRGQAQRMREFENQGQNDQLRRQPRVGGMAMGTAPNSMRTDRFARPDREPQGPGMRAGEGNAKQDLLRMGLQGAAALLGHLHKKGTKKVAVTDGKGNALRDASGSVIQKRKGGNKILKYLSENIGSLGEMAMGAMQNRNRRRRNNNPHQIAGEEEQGY
jgi:hypothetical protein